MIDPQRTRRLAYHFALLGTCRAEPQGLPMLRAPWIVLYGDGKKRECRPRLPSCIPFRSLPPNDTLYCVPSARSLHSLTPSLSLSLFYFYGFLILIPCFNP